MIFTPVPSAENLTIFMLRTASRSFRLAATAGGCSDLSGKTGVAPAPRPGQQGLERNAVILPQFGGPLMLGGVTIDLTGTAAPAGSIFQEAGVLLQRKGCPFEHESCQ
ncbi:iron-sulfur cluster assembly accessory protein [Bradyrhizobium neotropicale]|uniref:iron-sulfur cluster assembly accessory protein n=1 Tax=Bradyrhizobium neotropicale TaxID=1497615 RepID=UPI001AD69BEA|nr:iron-sulfur cluster assembly accessory protein [Bradyrhizobium neotropicale]MBO4227817.1 iron-sulfur cluster assembly accessory protein [Bradyrhizobium neotropicale]